jgi:hypothetical protein
MSKIKYVLALAAVVLLTACGKQAAQKTSSVYQHSTSQLQKNDQVWAEEAVATAALDSKNGLTAEKRTNDDKLAPWITSKGKFYNVANYQQTNYAAIKKQLKKNDSMPQNLHFVTVKQVNATLKTLGATVRIKSLNDLVYIKQTNGTTFQNGTGFLIAGDKLYDVYVSYTSGTKGASVNRGTVYTRKLKYASSKAVTPAAIAGLWQASDGTKALVKNQQLVTIQNDAFVRGTIENLGALKQSELYGTMSYYLRQTTTTKKGVKLSSNSLASGDLWGNLYVFLSASKMVQVTNSSVKVFTKTGAKDDTADFPKQVFTAFKELDKEKSTSGVAGYLLPKGNNTYSVGLVSSTHFVLQNYTTGISGAEAVSVDSKGNISVGADMNHN